MIRRNCKFFAVLLLLLAFMFVVQEHAFASETASLDIEYGRQWWNIRISQDGKPDYSDMYSDDAYIYLHSNSDYHEQYAGVKGTLVWDFHSLLVNVKLLFSMMLTDESRPLRMCKNCQRAFIAKRKNEEFCSPDCRGKYRNRR